MREYDLSAIHRKLHHNRKCYIWRKRNPVKYARLDIFLASNIFNIANNSESRISYRPDHFAIELDLMLNQFSHGKGDRKFKK